MKTRIITAAVLVPILLIVLLALPKYVAAVIIGIMSALAAVELLKGTGYVRKNRLVLYAAVMAFCVSLWCYFDQPYAWGLAALLVLFIILGLEMMKSHIKLQFEKVALCLVAGLLIPFLLSSLIRIHIMEGVGRYCILIPFIMAFLPDTGAYFVGSFLGRHKLAPVISPKKTVEGAVGGVFAGIVGMLIYALVLDLAFDLSVNYAYALIYGVLGAACSMVGDLTFSVIKRQSGIKDYGKLFPGHGGILDRFDSMIVVGPTAELLLILVPLVVQA